MRCCTSFEIVPAISSCSRVRLQGGEELVCGRDGECGGLADVPPVEEDGTGFGAQTLAFALRAARVAAVFREHDADVQLVLLALHELRRSRGRRGRCLCLPAQNSAAQRSDRTTARSAECLAARAARRISV